MSKLVERRKLYGIPELPYLPANKVVLVFRIPNEKLTAGGLVIPQVWTEKTTDGMGNIRETVGAAMPDARGVLVSAGLKALDVMKDHLIEIGDIVWFGQFAGWEEEFARDPENTGKKILQLKVDELLGSVDALERVGTTHTLAYDDKEGEHYYEEKVSNGNGRHRTRIAGDRAGSRGARSAGDRNRVA